MAPVNRPERAVQPHPPGAIPRYFNSSPFDGVPLSETGTSRQLALYEELSAAHFGRLPSGIAPDELEALDKFLLARLEIEREERRMHFGALALMAVLFFLLLPGLVGTGFANLALVLLELLLLALVVPYVFVYFGYENRVRAMALGHLRLLEAIALRDQQRAG